jgi:outer membrane protein assembly factor BamB
VYLDQVLRVSGKAAKAVRGALGEMGADAIRAAIVKALGKQVATNALPAWLVVENRPLERLVHLAPPLFDAVGADGDEFWSDCEAPQRVWSDGKVTQRTPGKADKVIALTDAQIASLDAYATDADLVLAAITWHEPAPSTKKQFGTLLEAATNAYTGELVAYDPTPPPPSVPTTGGPAIGVTTLGTGRDGRFGATFANEPKVVWARATGNSSADEWGGSVVVGEGIAVGAKSGYTCKVEAFDAATGKSKWCTETAKTQCWPASAIAIAGGTV